MATAAVAAQPGQIWSDDCYYLDRETGEMIQLPAVPTSRKSVRAFLDSLAEPVTIILEASTPARWIALEETDNGVVTVGADGMLRPSTSVWAAWAYRTMTLTGWS
ncbi:MAG: hypothetical protein HC793_02865, partial [Aquincola sp.]|nr:hypothetical protein [Aquincola sp.]